MSHKNYKIMPKNRRGVSSVVGALFFTVLMIAGFSVLSLALDAQTDIVTTQRLVSDVEIKKQQEQFGVLASVDGNNHLNVSVHNQGQNSVEISSIWIVNKTLADQPAQRFEISYDDAFIPSGFTSDTLDSQTLEMVDDTYDIKVVSALGTIKIVELTVGAGGGGGSGLRAELITDPPDVIIGQNVTVAMLVTNTGIDTITNVQPDPITFTPTGSGAATSFSSHSPNSVNLNGGASVMFSWDYQVTGDSGDQLSFSSIARGDGATSNTVSDISILREPTDGGSEGEEVVIKDELFGRPQIFMTIPNALGDEDDDVDDGPVWGVMVANPTDQPMFVTKVVVIAISPRATSSDKVFTDGCENDNGKPEKPQTISPTVDRWSCPESNQLMWKDVANPQRIEPRSVFPFMAKVGAGNMGSSLPDAQNIVIQPIVFTTLGQFGKAGYGSTMHSSDVALPNVFLATTPQSVSKSHILGEMRGITEGTVVTFHATLADMSSDDEYGIESGTDLIINVPKDWTFGSISSHSGFNTPSVVTYPDGSTQIVGDLINSIDEHSEAKTITFTATAPAVTNAKMYVMHLLAHGTATGDVSGGSDFTVGPLSEAVLQVCPTSGCP